jgi:sugar phosphate isomerase/epimerase
MKRILFSLLLTASAAFAGDFSGTAGLQLYSLREEFKKDVPGTLDKVKALGFTEVETATTYGLPNEKFVALLAERGLKPVSGHFPYEALSKDLAGAVSTAKALGLKFAACPWIPHEIANFNEATCRKAAADFNEWGAAFAKEGIKFAYHAHGYEFIPFGDGTLFDLLVKETKPEAVSFEMDVFWIMHPGQDPVKLLEKYPNRWALMHLKDIRKGAKTGVPSGRAPLTDDVAIGTGMTNWPAVLRTAAKVGVQHYFIEDESPTVEQQIPVSLEYLKSLK